MKPLFFLLLSAVAYGQLPRPGSSGGGGASVSGTGCYEVASLSVTDSVLATITHNLGTVNVYVSLIDHTSKAAVTVAWTAATINTVTFTPSATQTLDGSVCAGIGSALAYPAAGIGVSTGIAWGSSLSSTAPNFTTSVTTPFVLVGPQTGYSSTTASFLALAKNNVTAQNYAGSGTFAIGLLGNVDSNLDYTLWGMAGKATYTGSATAGTSTYTGVACEGSSTGTGAILSLYGCDAAAILYAGATAVQLIGYHVQNATASANTLGATYGIYNQNISNTGGGTINNQYGMYVESLTAATNNWAIYTDGTTKSHFGGAVDVVGLQVVATTSDPGCTTTGHIGKFWFNNTTTTTVVNVCVNVAGTVGWSAVTKAP